MGEDDEEGNEDPHGTGVEAIYEAEDEGEDGEGVVGGVDAPQEGDIDVVGIVDGTFVVAGIGGGAEGFAGCV